MPAVTDVHLRDESEGAGSVCRLILETLPHWFGIPESVDDYVDVADRAPTVIASLDDSDVGLLTVVTHSPDAAEIYVMAVLPDHHRRGIGRSMLHHAENTLAHDGIEFLQVKTLSARRRDEGYEKTRAFYRACGFRDLQEFPDLWGPQHPALQMIKVVAPPSLRPRDR